MRSAHKNSIKAAARVPVRVLKIRHNSYLVQARPNPVTGALAGPAVWVHASCLGPDNCVSAEALAAGVRDRIPR